MAKVPKKILKWRANQPSGKIMSPEKFESIKKGVTKSGSAYDPQAVAGAKYWEKVRKDYAAKHCPAEPL